MPIYEYKCSECESHFEKMQKISEEPLKVCAECGGALVKQWSLSGFQFKGAGWYVTDYAGKKSGAEAEKAEKSSTGESTAGADSASKKETDSSAGSKETKKETGPKKV